MRVEYARTTLLRKNIVLFIYNIYVCIENEKYFGLRRVCTIISVISIDREEINGIF